MFCREQICSFSLIFCLFTLSLGCVDFFSGGDLSADKIEIISEVKSPDGKFVATSFSCSGGGAAGYFYFNASLRKAGAKLDQRDGLLGKHKTWKGFSDIEVKWIDDRNLEVSCKENNSTSYLENNSVKAKTKHGIKIHYKFK